MTIEDKATTDLPPKKRSVLWWIGGALLLLFVLFLYQLFGPNPAIVVSKPTTHITAPLKPDGLPDYAQHLRDVYRTGVTPENNAAVVLWQHLWPEDIDPQELVLIREELGLEGISTPD